MIGSLIGPITNIVGGLVQGKMEQKAAETKMKVAKADAQAKIMLSQATSEADWDKIMAEGSHNSWKDEYLVILLTFPMILCFCGDWGRTVVAEGFIALENMPSFYQYFVGSAVAASFGIKGAAKVFGKK
tara:strand:- start:2530 stop:2916 length:387 start_codon:yes stop_codon:yes gene_type:complete